jgi:shikimate dehydrogenase
MSSRMRFALLGRSVRTSPSPAMHIAAINALGLSHGYTAVDVPSESSLRTMVEELRRGVLAGANVTAPYKTYVLELADVVTDAAREVGAANLLRRLPNGKVEADNTDRPALERVIRDACGATSRAAIVGAGGAARAATAALRNLGFSVVAVTSRSWSDSDVLLDSEAADKMRALGAMTLPWPSLLAVQPRGKASQVMRLQWSELAQQADVVIQATIAGSAGGPSGEEVASIVPWPRLPNHATALDVVYREHDTPFVREAKVRNLKAEDGLRMLVAQAELSFRRWLDVEPPKGVMMAAACRALGRTPAT